MTEDSIDQRLAQARALVARLEKEAAKARDPAADLRSTAGEYWYRVVVVFTIQVLVCAILAKPTYLAVLLPYVWPMFLLRLAGTLPVGLEHMDDNLETGMGIAVVLAFVYSMVISWIRGRSLLARRALERLRERESA